VIVPASGMAYASKFVASSCELNAWLSQLVPLAYFHLLHLEL